MTVTVNGIKINPLKWKDKKALRQDGYDLAKIDETKDNDDLVERVVTMALEDDVAIDDMEMHQVYDVFGKVMELSFLGKVSEKNLSSQPS